MGLHVQVGMDIEVRAVVEGSRQVQDERNYGEDSTCFLKQD